LVAPYPRGRRVIETLREMFEETLKDFHFAENGIVNAAQEG